jgi:hypothetical protein
VSWDVIAEPNRTRALAVNTVRPGEQQQCAHRRFIGRERDNDRGGEEAPSQTKMPAYLTKPHAMLSAT